MVVFTAWDKHTAETWLIHSCHAARKQNVPDPWMTVKEALHPCGDVWNLYQIHAKPETINVLF